MKLIYLILLSFSSSIIEAQVAIGKNTVQTGVSLEFGSGNKGLILPWVTNVTNVALNSTSGLRGGALVLDVNDRKVKISSNVGVWSDLTIYDTASSNAIDNSLQLGANTENTAAKSQIGGTSVDSTPGILVLADTNKAMIPPLVNSPELNIQNPAPGMIVFDSAKKLFCVYNGTVWSYWRADD